MVCSSEPGREYLDSWVFQPEVEYGTIAFGGCGFDDIRDGVGSVREGRPDDIAGVVGKIADLAADDPSVGSEGTDDDGPPRGGAGYGRRHDQEGGEAV